MSYLTIKNVCVAGMAACVPSKIEENVMLPLFENEKEAQKIISSTGISRKHVVEQGTTASDLAFEAANKLIKDLGWEKTSIDLLVYVCQSRDYIAPMTSCILQDRLGLSNECCVFDVPLGCCGFVHGLSIASSMLSHGGLKRGLLINAETNSLNRSPLDRSVKPLFGDAGTVTALEFNQNASPMNFTFGVDGSGWSAIYTEFGGIRNPVNEDALKFKEIEPGIKRRGIDMVVNGMDVFSFAIRQPPKSLRDLIDKYEINIDNVDLLLLHQANLFIDEKIRKSIKMPAEKTPYCLQDYGNVTSASIPLTLVTRCKNQLQNKTNHIIACGFGVGLEWGSVELNINNIVCPEVIEV